MKPERWEAFLEEIANEYELRGKLREIFLVRFAHENWHKQDEELWEIAEAASPETYKKQKTSIYSQFSKNRPNGCAEVCFNGEGPGKFEKLRVWLRENRHPEWLSNQKNITSNSGKSLVLDDTYYVERPPIEFNCYRAIVQPGALIRIKAPQQMGKSLLLERIMAQARQQGYQTVTLSFNLADSNVFSNYQNFAQWFCGNVGELLELPNQLTESWDDILGCNRNSTIYFEKYLLATQTNPLVLALDKVDVVFENSGMANDFCRLLRGWHDMAKRGDRKGIIWQQLRLVIVHSTEVYRGLDINHSPLANVGKIVPLPEFTPEQVRDLVGRYELDGEPLSFTPASGNDLRDWVDELMGMVGGHPYLVRQSLDYLKYNQVTLAKFLQIAPTESDPFGNHLREYLSQLKDYSELAAGFRDVVRANEPIQLESGVAFKLQSMGLVKIEGDNCSPRCDLYRRYFRDRLDRI